jgi:hypothetical protein
LDSILIFLLYDGGIAFAFLFLLNATLAWKSGKIRKLLYAFSFLALIAQAGCWHLATAIGNSRGGHGEDEFGMDNYVFLAGAVLFVWAFILELIGIKSEPKKRHDASGSTLDDYGRRTDR